jgi:hypothetical protein
MTMMMMMMMMMALKIRNTLEWIKSIQVVYISSKEQERCIDSKEEQGMIFHE